MKLSQKQALFFRCTVTFYAWVLAQEDDQGHQKYRLRYGDAYRDPRVKYGHPKSTHRSRLAVDLILDKWNGKRWVYQRSTKAYEELGLYWESLHPLARWGGRFRDGNHFSFEHQGVK